MQLLITVLASAGVFLFFMVQPVAAQVVINEIMADPAAALDKSEWIELYNYSDADIDLRGWSVDGKLIASDAAVTVSAGGYLIITKTLSDFNNEFGVLPNSFQLSISLTNAGKTLELTNGMGYADSLTYSAATPGVSWERKGYICAELVKHPATHSLNASNIGLEPTCNGEEPTDEPPVDLLPTVQISEVFPSPRTDKQEQEWVELYNWGGLPVDLAGWKFSDARSTYTLPDLTIAPGQYLVLTDFGLSLNNGGDSLGLTDAAQNAVDTMEYPETKSGYAQMRVWDTGKYATTLQQTARPTSGLINVYQADRETEVVKEVVTVTEKVEVLAQCPAIQTTHEPAVLAASEQIYELPATEIYRLDLPADEPATGLIVSIWPIFGLICVGLVMLLGADKDVQRKFIERVGYLNRQSQWLVRVKSRLLSFVSVQSA